MVHIVILNIPLNQAEPASCYPIPTALQTRLDDNEAEFNSKIKAMMREFSAKMEEKERQFHATFSEAVGKCFFLQSAVDLNFK